MTASAPEEGTSGKVRKGGDLVVVAVRVLAAVMLTAMMLAACGAEDDMSWCEDYHLVQAELAFQQSLGEAYGSDMTECPPDTVEQLQESAARQTEASVRMWDEAPSDVENWADAARMCG